MSKQSEAKVAQGYTPKSPTCADCKHLKFDMVPPKWMVDHNERIKSGTASAWQTPYDLEKNSHPRKHRCGMGGFAVKKQGSCIFIAV